MAKVNKQKSKAKTSGFMKILEVVMIIGAIAGVLINLFGKAKKAKK